VRHAPLLRGLLRLRKGGKEMNYASVLFFGVFLSFALSWVGMVFTPQLQLGRAQLVETQDTKQLYPLARTGLAEQGKEVYRSLGCAACHTQQVRENDVPRWGKRISVAQDYLRDRPVLTSSQRLGPDLATIGEPWRMPDAKWHLRHLYNPENEIHSPTLKHSPMPPYRFLFEKRKIGRQKSPDAIEFSPEFPGVEKGFEIIPKKEALALVAYLQSMTLTNFFYDVPNPNPPKPPLNTNLPPDIREKALALYPTTCGACHQADGQGLPGQFPPLAGSEWVLAADPSRIIRIVLNGATGPIEVNGTTFNNAMVPWKDVMQDDDIAAILTYVRNEWGNAAPLVKPEQVAAIRAKEKDRVDAWTAEELQKIELSPAASAK
jgi:cytochrome c oxidase cbb3-type subunit 2